MTTVRTAFPYGINTSGLGDSALAAIGNGSTDDYAGFNALSGPQIFIPKPGTNYSLSADWVPASQNARITMAPGVSFSSHAPNFNNLISNEASPGKLVSLDLISNTYGTEWSGLGVGNIFQSASWADANFSTAIVVAQYGSGRASVSGARSWGANFAGIANASGATAITCEMNPLNLVSGGVAYGNVIASSGPFQIQNAEQIDANDSTSQYYDGWLADFHTTRGCVTNAIWRAQGDGSTNTCQRFLYVNGITASVAEVDLPSLLVNSTVANTVTRIRIDGASTGNDPSIRPSGTDTNGSINIIGKGNGGAALVDGASNRRIFVNTSGAYCQGPFSLLSSGASQYLSIGSTEALTAGRSLNFTVGDASRNVTFFGNTIVPVASQNLTFAGPTAARTITLPDANFTAARTDAGNTFTGHQTIEGVTSTGATGTGNFVFDTSPTLVTPKLGAALADSISIGGALLTGLPVGANPVFELQGTTNSSTGAALANWSSTIGRESNLQFVRSVSNVVGTRGGITADNTKLGSIPFIGDDGTSWLQSVTIEASSDGASSTGVMPGKIVFSTNGGSSSVTERLRIRADGYASFSSGGIAVNGNPLISSTIPTITSGFGTGASIVANGTASFRISIGTGGAATGGVLAMPTAANNWNAVIQVLNPNSTNCLQETFVSASSQTSITLSNLLLSTGAPAAWPSGTVLIVNATAY